MENKRFSAGKWYRINPRQLLFTQADIKSTFTDPTLPCVRETASLIRRGLLDPTVLAPLYVSIDEYCRFWCANNRRLFAIRLTGVSSIDCVCLGNRRPQQSLKEKLSDPAFMPKVRGEASCVRVPPLSNSLVGNASAGYLNMQLYKSHEGEDEEDELGARFSQLDLRATSSCYPTRTESASSRKWGKVNHNVFTQPYHIPSNFDPIDFGNPNDSVPVGRGKNAVESKPNNLSFVPRISGGASGVRIPPPPTSGRANGYQMDKGVSVSSGSSVRELHETHVDDVVHFKYRYKEENVEYEYTVPYEGAAKDDEEYGYEDEGKYEYTVSSEGKYVYESENPVECCHDEEYWYEDEGKYEYTVSSEGEYVYESENPVQCYHDKEYGYDNEAKYKYPVQCYHEAKYEYPVASEGFRHEGEDIVANMVTYFEIREYLCDTSD